MRRLLVPLDGSALSESVLPLARVLAAGREAEIVLVRVLRPHPAADLEREAQREAEEYLARQGEALREQGVRTAPWRVWYGEPEQAIADAAAYVEAGLIAMTTHGRGGLSRLLLGSVAAGVVRHARIPVLLVRGTPVLPATLGRILVPLDGSPLAEAVLPAVVELADPLHLGIDLLHVVEPLPVSVQGGASLQVEDLVPGRREEAVAYLERIRAGLAAQGLPVRCVVRPGPAVDTIAQCGSDEAVSLIAMSTHGRSGLGRLLLGSVAEQVMRVAVRPVLLWKSPLSPGSPGIL